MFVIYSDFASGIDKIIAALPKSREYFPEIFEIDDTEDKEYTKISVPEFRNGREGHFIHDFKSNLSVIIDDAANRCFLMPLDRTTIMEPKSMLELMDKIWTGEYSINTDTIKKNFRVALPALDTFDEVPPRILDECDPTSKKIYKLEKFVNGGKKKKNDKTYFICIILYFIFSL